ncbi:hypothetical protein ACLOJK_010238 [Asimina triloba]
MFPRCAPGPTAVLCLRFAQLHLVFSSDSVSKSDTGLPPSESSISSHCHWGHPPIALPEAESVSQLIRIMSFEDISIFIFFTLGNLYIDILFGREDHGRLGYGRKVTTGHPMEVPINLPPPRNFLPNLIHPQKTMSYAEDEGGAEELRPNSLDDGVDLLCSMVRRREKSRERGGGRRESEGERRERRGEGREREEAGEDGCEGVGEDGGCRSRRRGRGEGRGGEGRRGEDGAGRESEKMGAGKESEKTGAKVGVEIGREEAGEDGRRGEGRRGEETGARRGEGRRGGRCRSRRIGEGRGGEGKTMTAGSRFFRR